VIRPVTSACALRSMAEKWDVVRRTISCHFVQVLERELTLQQLDTHLRGSLGPSILSTNLLLTAGVSAIPNCETDLFVVTQGVHRIEVAVGECKDGGGKIDLKDAQNMAAIADSFPRDIFETYIIFSKTGPFTAEEIDNCQQAQKGWTRVILLSSKELEPYHIYEKSSTDFDVSASPNSLHEMTRVTSQIYFQTKTKTS
jgi:hypothetical protein